MAGSPPDSAVVVVWRVMVGVDGLAALVVVVVVVVVAVVWRVEEAVLEDLWTVVGEY